VVDEPTSSVKYGSVVAAPYAASVLESTLPYIGIISDVEEPHTLIADFVGMNVNSAVSQLKKSGLNYEIIGSGTTVIAQTPTANEECIKTKVKIILYTEKRTPDYIEVPNVIGMEASEANKLLLDRGFNLKIKGIKTNYGGATVIYQSLNPGNVVPTESVIELEIVYTDFED
jgi:beta-lactam-binding protein with PASTA domain